MSWDCVPDYVYLEPRDAKRMASATRKTHTRRFKTTAQVMRLGWTKALNVLNDEVVDVYACTALVGVVADKVACGIYEERPKACRRFEPGSEDCLEMRLRANLPAAPPEPTRGE